MEALLFLLINFLSTLSLSTVHELHWLHSWDKESGTLCCWANRVVTLASDAGTNFLRGFQFCCFQIKTWTTQWTASPTARTCPTIDPSEATGCLPHSHLNFLFLSQEFVWFLPESHCVLPSICPPPMLPYRPKKTPGHPFFLHSLWTTYTYPSLWRYVS